VTFSLDEGREEGAMRIWDIPPEKLCRQHLLGEHRELHAIWVILTQKKRGYAKHPETIRWRGKLKALYLRHQGLVQEMKKRGYQHGSPLPKELAIGSARQTSAVNSYEEQVSILRDKACPCQV